MISDYERIARVILYLDRTHHEQPSLAQIARAAGLSPAHFQRIFSQWAGSTPKDLIGCLRLNNAKTLLQKGTSILDTARASGLSRPSHLHDSYIDLESTTPGEIKSWGRGLLIECGFSKTSFGEIFIAQTPRGICHISFTDGHSEKAISKLQTTWPESIIKLNKRKSKQLGDMIFMRGGSSHRKSQKSIPPGNLRLYVAGTPFQIRVWRALLTIPEGSVVSYGALAKAIGSPDASRAVGTAIGSNPIAYIIPCHRVIRETGIIGNYRWGSTRKRAILIRESLVSRQY